MLLLSQAVGLVITLAVVALAGEAPAASATLGWAALSGILDLAGLWALYRGLSRESMSVVAPLAATAALVPTVYGIAIGERPAALALSGIALAVVGVALAGRSESADDGGPLARGVGLALLAALCFGLGFIALDTASEGGVTWTLLANRLGSVLVLGLVWGLDAWAGDFEVDGDDGLHVSRVAVKASLPGGPSRRLRRRAGHRRPRPRRRGAVRRRLDPGPRQRGVDARLSLPRRHRRLARLLLKERLTRGQLAGVTVAMAGVVAISAA